MIPVRTENLTVQRSVREPSEAPKMLTLCLT